MFSQPELKAALATVPLVSRVIYYPSTGSTNDVMRELAGRHTPHGTLVVADEQTAGRGRAGRRWLTPRAMALASTCLLRPTRTLTPGRLALLGGLAAAQAIEQCTALSAHIKWPNDIWVNERKVGGVLVETNFTGNRLDWALIGVGINVNGQLPDDLQLQYPATTLQAELGRPTARLALLVAQMAAFKHWLAALESPAFIAAVNARLLWRGQRVQVVDSDRAAAQPAQIGMLHSVTAAGELQLQLEHGEMLQIPAGELHLRRA